MLDRRSGVDLFLGGPAVEFVSLEAAGKLAPGMARVTAGGRPIALASSGRIGPDELARAKGFLRSEGWAKGYDGLVREAAWVRPGDGRPEGVSGPSNGFEFLAVVEGPNRVRAANLVRDLTSVGFVSPISAGDRLEAAADGLLADLLGAALVDSREELRRAVEALERFGHPPRAEGSLGERPPWPPASVAKLQAGPGGEALVETLLGQIAPDSGCRAWLAESWSGPRRQVDGDVLAEVAGAAGGKLAREPRFRAWLRGEWTAWTRQLYRRVARLAGGYVPS